MRDVDALKAVESIPLHVILVVLVLALPAHRDDALLRVRRDRILRLVDGLVFLQHHQISCARKACLTEGVLP